MKKVELVFYVDKCEKNNDFVLLTGRLLQKMNLDDEIIVIENIDYNFVKNNCDKEDCFWINDDMLYNHVQIKKIFSYGVYWESLDAGMTARLDCLCSKNDLKGLFLCKFLNT